MITPAVRAVVLAAGRGTRMQARDPSGPPLDPAQAAAADTGAKAMMPFGRPFLDYVLHEIAEAGIRSVALVLAPSHDEVRDYYRALRLERITVAFVTQPEPLGTAHAVGCAREWVDGDPFLVLNGDNLYPADVLTRLVAASGPAVPGFFPDSLGLSPERLGSFALIERDGDGHLAAIVEKPGEAAIAGAGPRALISMNVWRFDWRIFDACARVPLSSRGERELPQAVALAAGEGVAFEVIPVRARVLDLSRRADVAGVAADLAGRTVRL
jgi:glucose-1-phosphate thymidylyltransferase